jgi:hypothetical protein
MGNKLDPKETASFEEVMMSNVYTQEAIINILERKGLLTRKEVLEEIVKLRKT